MELRSQAFSMQLLIATNKSRHAARGEDARNACMLRERVLSRGRCGALEPVNRPLAPGLEVGDGSAVPVRGLWMQPFTSAALCSPGVACRE